MTDRLAEIEWRMKALAGHELQGSNTGPVAYLLARLRAAEKALYSHAALAAYRAEFGE